MSILRSTDVVCPACGAHVSFELVHSVNGDRRPDLRAAILDGTFQLQACTSCGTAFRVDPEFTYLEVGAGAWLAVFPAADREDWEARERRATATLDTAFGAGAPAAARALGQRLRGRVVFGWAALSEKLRAWEAGIPDVDLELLKVLLLRNGHAPSDPIALEARLAGVDTDATGAPTLRFSWVDPVDETVAGGIEVPRALLDDVAAPAWGELRAELDGRLFVDAHRWTAGA